MLRLSFPLKQQSGNNFLASNWAEGALLASPFFFYADKQNGPYLFFSISFNIAI